ncbi:hypothetical protein D3C72_1458000 [compost metagenome]
MKRHMRVAHHEVRQHGADVNLQQRHRTRHTHNAARRRAGHVDGVLRRLRLHQHRLAVLVVGAADLRHGELARGAVDQPHAEPLLQQADAPAELGLRHPQRTAGRREAAMFHCLHVVVEIVQILHACLGLSFTK